MKRRAVLLFTAMAAALLLAGGTALALDKVCTSSPCNGTTGKDLLIGTDNSGVETINGDKGDDLIIGNGGQDTFNDPAVTNAREGSDTYIFADGFGSDLLYDTGATKDRDTVDFSKVPGGMAIYAIPEWDGTGKNRALGATGNVGFGSFTPPFTTIGKIVGTAGQDEIRGGKETNTYDLRAGGGDSVYDHGGCTGNQCLDPSVPLTNWPSNDTYTGYKAGNVSIIDYGGSGDVLDLRPRKVSDVSFKSQNNYYLVLTLSSDSSDKIWINNYFGASQNQGR